MYFMNLGVKGLKRRGEFRKMMSMRHPIEPWHSGLGANAGMKCSQVISLFLIHPISVLSLYKLFTDVILKFRNSPPTKPSRQRPVHPQQLRHPSVFRRSKRYSKVVLTTGKTASDFRANILSITTTPAPSTPPATSRPSLVGCGPWSCLRATQTGPCQSCDPPRCTKIRRSAKTLRTGPLTDSRLTGWKRYSRRVPTGASRAVFPRTASTTETTCAPTSQSWTRWLSREREYARKPSTWTCEATTARAAQVLGGNKAGGGSSITTVPWTGVSLGVPLVL